MTLPRPVLLALDDLDAGPGRALLDATVAQGFSEPVARAGLRAELDAWHAPGAVERVLDELPTDLDPRRLPGTVLVLAAGTLPASAMREVLFARLLGARVLLKPASGQAALAHALAAADPSIEPRPFASSDTAALDAAIAESDSVVVLGQDRTVDAVRARVPPRKACIGYGHRLSVAVLEDCGDDALRGLALDLLAWDQAGCLSPQMAWVAGDAASVGPRLAEHVRDVEAALPMTLPPAAAPARHAALALAEATGAAWRTGTSLVLSAPGSSFRASPGFRVLWLAPMDRAALSGLAPVLSSVAYAGPASRRPALPGVRVCAPGELQSPPLDWPHDGGPNLPPMLRPTG